MLISAVLQSESVTCFICVCVCVCVCVCMYNVIHWKRPWCWVRLKARGEGIDRGWDGCMASPSQWTWVWASSGSWWWTGRPGMLQSRSLKELDMTERLNWTDIYYHLVQYQKQCNSILEIIHRSPKYLLLVFWVSLRYH